MFGREPKVRLSDVAKLGDTFRTMFEAGVAATKVELPEQFMMTPEQVLAEQAQMQADAGWIASGEAEEED